MKPLSYTVPNRDAKMGFSGRGGIRRVDFALACKTQRVANLLLVIYWAFGYLENMTFYTAFNLRGFSNGPR